jgi:hypothetical protein
MSYQGAQIYLTIAILATIFRMSVSQLTNYIVTQIQQLVKHYTRHPGTVSRQAGRLLRLFLLIGGTHESSANLVRAQV